MSTRNLRVWTPPAGVRSVLIAADRGKDGEASADRLKQRLSRGGRGRLRRPCRPSPGETGTSGRRRVESLRLDLLLSGLAGRLAVAPGRRRASRPSSVRASVVDGDTLTVAGVRIRIWGIDAPEGRQICQDAAGHRYACGEVSTARMRTLVAAGDVSCVVRDHDQYGRSVSQCRAGAQDLGAAMVADGLAVEYRQLRRRRLCAPAEAEARRARRGPLGGDLRATVGMARR